MNYRMHWAMLGLLSVVSLGARGQSFHWGSDGFSLSSGVTPSMFLRDDNVAEVDAFLAGQTVKALKLDGAVSAATINAIYNKYKIDYTFVDAETSDAVTRMNALAGQIRNSAGTGVAMASGKAFVSNYGFAPLSYDPTRAGKGWGYKHYTAAGVNMASESLYPGAWDFRGPASGNSSAPNVRSALFTMPIERFSLAAATLPGGAAHIPYVNRFNNWGNLALDTDGNASNGYRFETNDQLLSRGDFKAQVMHYRLRGANGVIGLDGGVEGYSARQFQADISNGWGGVRSVNQVLSDPSARKVSLATQLKTDGVVKAIEETGVVYSGAYSTAQGKMVVLVSNLDDLKHKVELPAKVGGKRVGGSFDIEPGTHEILEFGMTGMRWNLVSAAEVFVDNQRAGVGVPEPGAVGMVVLAGGVGLLRRRRRA